MTALARGRRLAVPVGFLLFAIASGCRQRTPLSEAQVVAAAPTGGEVTAEDLTDGVRVTFDRAVAPPGSLGRVIPGPAFVVEPALAGEARWLDPQTLGFFPRAALRRSTAYSFKLAEDLVVAPGLRPGKWGGLRLVFSRLAVEQVSFQGWRELQPRRPLVTVRASQPIAADSATAACGFFEKRPDGGEGRRASAILAARPRPDAGSGSDVPDSELAADLAGQRAVQLEPAEPLTAGSPYLFRCGPGLRPRDGGEGLLKPHEETFATHGPAAIKAIAPQGRDIAADSVPIRIEFATPMDPDEVRRRVELRGPRGRVAALDLAANYRRTLFSWSGDLEPGTSYELVVEAGLTDQFGQTLAGQRRHRFRVGDASPRLHAETGIYVVERSNGRYPMWTRNLSRVEARCAAVPDGRVAAVLTGPANQDAWWDTESRGPIEWKKLGLQLRTTDIRPDAARNRWHDQTLALGPTCASGGSAAAGSGLYLLELVTDEERGREGRAARRERRSLVNVTDLGLLAKVGNTDSLVWVVRLSTGAPVPGAAVAIRDLKGRLRWSGTTNADGVAQGPGAARLTGQRPRSESAEAAEESEGEDDGGRRVVVTARAGDELAVLDTSWQSGIQNWNFGVSEDRRLRDRRLRGFLHSDRGLYRPGDTVHLRGLLRALDRQGAMSVPRGKVQLVIEDPRGATAVEREVALTGFGGFHHDLALPAEARLGDWRVRATLAGFTVSERFAVEEYRPRTFEVKVKAPANHGLLGQPLRFEVEASFLYGSPLGGGKLDWAVRRRAHLPQFEGFEGYVFRDFANLADADMYWARSEERSFSDGIADGQVTLDGAGKTQVETRDVNVESQTGPQDYLIEATVTDSSGQAVSSGAVVTAHAGDLYLGLRPAEYVQAADAPFAVQVVAFDRKGVRKAANVELTLTRRQYECGPGKAAGGDPDVWGCRRNDDPAPAVRRTIAVPAAGTAAVVQVVVNRPGEYVARVSAGQGRGRAVASDLFYVVGKGDAYWSGDEGERMTLIASKPRYKPGDVARLVPQAQLGPALALVTLERDGVLSYQLRPLGSSGEAIEIPIERRLAPNVFASVVMVRGRNGEGDRGRPRFKMGLVNLEVDASERRLEVAVTPERPSYRPGETVRARLRVTSGGAPVRAELAVAAADEGVLQILGYRTPDPLPAFYAPFALGLDSATSWNRLLRARDPSGAAADDGEEGGDGGGDEAGRVRSRFQATAFWTPALVTGSDGTAEVSFPAPDNLTAFRVMAVAADRGDRFGSGEARFNVNKPLQAVPALPRFLSPGDQAQAAVTLHNNGPSPTTVTVALEATGVELAGAASQRIDVPARSHRQAVFGVRATSAGKAAFTFRASGGGETDAVRVEIPVLQAIIRSSELVAEGSTRGRIEAVVPAVKQALPGRGGLEVVLDRTGLARVSEGFHYLIEYPYGCLEQTTSKVVPLVALADLAAIGLPEGEAKGAEGRIRGFVQAGVAKILRHQNDDGGFGLWIGASSELHYTAYALWGLEIARRGGYTFPEGVSQEGVRYLKERLQAKGPAAANPAELSGEVGTRAFVHHVLAELGQGDPGALGALFGRRQQLPVYGRAFLLRALVRTERAAEARTLAAELMASIPGSAGPVIVKEGTGLDWYWSSDVRTTALTLLALIEAGPAAGPASAAVARLTQGLLGARQEGRWSSTQENVYGLTALAALARARAAGPPVRVSITVGGGPAHTSVLDGTAVERLRLPLPAPGGGPLVIAASGGEIYYGARLHIERAVSPQAHDAGLGIRREYLDPDSGAPVGALKLGKVVKVRLTVRAPTRLAHVAIVDRLPAGLEPVITRFRRTEQEGPAEEERPAWWGPGWKTLWQHQELRDDRALVFADVLAAGESRHEYLVRATTAGRFLIPPATGEAMYRPELHGRSAGGSLVVER